MIGNVANDSSQIWAWWQAQQAQQSTASGDASGATGAQGNADVFSLSDCTAPSQGGASGPPVQLSSDIVQLLQSDGTDGSGSANGASQQTAATPHHHHHHHQAAATDPTQTGTTDPTQIAGSGTDPTATALP